MSNIKQNKEPKDENGKRHGECIWYHNNGRLWFRYNYVHGVPHGLHEGYYFNGELEFRGYWNMGREIGYWVESRNFGQSDWYNEKQYYLCLI